MQVNRNATLAELEAWIEKRSTQVPVIPTIINRSIRHRVIFRQCVIKAIHQCGDSHLSILFRDRLKPIIALRKLVSDVDISEAP